MLPLASDVAAHAFITDAQRMILFADAAYCGDASHGSEVPIADWTCAPCKSAANVTTLGVVASAGRQTLAFVATDSVDNRTRIVASFRGSVLPRNFEDDRDQELVPWSGATGARVHRGLLASYLSLEAPFGALLRRALVMHPTAPIVVTGHSMGAAQAVYAATAVATNFSASNVTLIGFGTPRPGDASFAAAVRSRANLKTWTVTHRADIVPQCGIYPAPCQERARGFHQIGTTSWFAEDLVSPPLAPLDFRTCNGSGEDPHCEDAVAAHALNWADHDYYLEHSMYCCAKGHQPGPKGCPFPFPLRGAYLVNHNTSPSETSRCGPCIPRLVAVCIAPPLGRDSDRA